MRNLLYRAALLACAAFAAYTARADYIYFMLDDPALNFLSEKNAVYVTVSNVGQTGDEWKYNSNMSRDNIEYLGLYGGGDTEPAGYALAPGSTWDTSSTEAVYAYLGTKYNDDDRILFEAWVGEGEDMQGFYLYSSKIQYLKENITGGTSGGVPLYVGAVPEPSSGILVVFGLALTGLRRKMCNFNSTNKDC
ncbi:MAG: tail fiber protein [Kiritimatiellae bacterium]|nr:tail fiber protein [Kiritimatiellia bacterium]